MQHGEGTAYLPNGTILYKGGWKANEPHGQGVMNYSNGNVYVGQWVDGNRHGRGKMTFANKEVYHGQWMNDKRHGRGTITYPNGDVFIGEWTSQQKREGNTQHVDESGSVAKRPKVEVSP